MIEIPEAATLSTQLEDRFAGRTATGVEAGAWPHKFAWYFGDRDRYEEIVVGRAFHGAYAVGGMVEVALDGTRLLFAEGANLRYVAPGAILPEKRQFAVGFSDGSTLAASVQMYGGVGAFPEGQNDNPYYLVAQGKPSPLDAAFDAQYFDALLNAPSMEKLSAKAFLATEQRIPGLGNGVLQDILYFAGINPRRKVATLDDPVRELLFLSILNTLREMTLKGGRDTELDLFGVQGRYATVMSRNTVGRPCPRCGRIVEKASYMGGAVYYCPGCQPSGG